MLRRCHEPRQPYLLVARPLERHQQLLQLFFALKAGLQDVCFLLLQVQRLGAGDAPTTHRELYMRNVSSHSLDLDAPDVDPLPEPSRVSGDIISFDRCTASWSLTSHCSCGCAIMTAASHAALHACIHDDEHIAMFPISCLPACADV